MPLSSVGRPVTKLRISPDLDEYVDAIQQLAVLTQEARMFFDTQSPVVLCAWLWLQEDEHSQLSFSEKAMLIDVALNFKDHIPKAWNDLNPYAPNVKLTPSARKALKQVLRPKLFE